LYGGIQSDSARLHSCTIEDYLRHHPPQKQLTTLHTGSWIGSNFDIWIGEEEENRAWDLLGETRAFLQQKIDTGALTPAQHAMALREIYAAEGSDWFWWYGPDFSTENDALFDSLFRQHLRNVYTLCGSVAPAALDRPISVGRSKPLYSAPERMISPSLNGSHSFFDWLGAGTYTPGSEQGAMYRAERLISRVQFGNNADTLFLRVDLRKRATAELVVQFHQPTERQVNLGSLAIKRGFIHAGVPFSELGATPDSLVAFQVKVMQDGIELECYPESAPIQFALLGKDFALRNWIV
jgi:hypothetical protein